MSGADVKNDAVDRGWRTFGQGLLIDVAVAVAAVLLMWLPDADVTRREAWMVLATALLKTVLTAVASYVMRFKVAPKSEEDRGY